MQGLPHCRLLFYLSHQKLASCKSELCNLFRQLAPFEPNIQQSLGKPTAAFSPKLLIPHCQARLLWALYQCIVHVEVSSLAGGNGRYSAPVWAPGTLSCSPSGWFFPESGAVSSWPMLISVLLNPHSQPLQVSRLVFVGSSLLSVSVCPANSSHLDILRFPTHLLSSGCPLGSELPLPAPEPKIL